MYSLGRHTAGVLKSPTLASSDVLLPVSPIPRKARMRTMYSFVCFLAYQTNSPLVVYPQTCPQHTPLTFARRPLLLPTRTRRARRPSSRRKMSRRRTSVRAMPLTIRRRCWRGNRYAAPPLILWGVSLSAACGTRCCVGVLLRALLFEARCDAISLQPYVASAVDMRYRCASAAPDQMSAPARLSDTGGKCRATFCGFTVVSCGLLCHAVS